MKNYLIKKYINTRKKIVACCKYFELKEKGSRIELLNEIKKNSYLKLKKYITITNENNF